MLIPEVLVDEREQRRRGQDLVLLSCRRVRNRPVTGFPFTTEIEMKLPIQTGGTDVYRYGLNLYQDGHVEGM